VRSIAKDPGTPCQQSPHFLDACDELGIMVLEEPPGWGHMGDAAFQARMLRDVRDMVVRDRNRPSVVVWGTRLNETGNYPALYAQARQVAYACDGSRQTAGAVAFQTTAGWAEDVFSYDDYHVVDGEPELLPPVPGVPYLVSESVGALNPTYRWFDPPSVLANQAFAHALAHDQAQSDIRYAGLLAWAGFDYYSAGRNRKNWNTLRTPGVVDTFRVPKPGAAIYQSQVDPATRAVIVPVFSWDSRSASAGPGPDSMFATNCDRLEIFAGGTYLATATPDRARFGHLAHPPATWDGEPVSRDRPHGATVVVASRAPDGWRYLLLHRAHHGGPARAGDWARTSPTGSRRPREDVTACAVRELHEEIGLRACPLPVLIDDVDWAVYALEVPWGIRVAVDGEEHDRFEWVSFAEARRRCRRAELTESFMTACRASGFCDPLLRRT
jgi:8-oxo-dGTP pyrophosphatase MutT (NUDIX family)